MSDYATILSAARSLPPQDQLHLIDALWDQLAADTNLGDPSTAPLHAEWQTEIERRVAELKSGTVQTIPWEEIRSAALARHEHDKTN